MTWVISTGATMAIRPRSMPLVFTGRTTPMSPLSHPTNSSISRGGKSSTRTCGGSSQWPPVPRVGAGHGQQMLAFAPLLALRRPEPEAARPRGGVGEPAEGARVAGAAAHQAHAELVLPAHLQVEGGVGRQLALGQRPGELEHDLGDALLEAGRRPRGRRLHLLAVAAQAVDAGRDRGPARAHREERPGGLPAGVVRRARSPPSGCPRTRRGAPPPRRAPRTPRAGAALRRRGAAGAGSAAGPVGSGGWRGRPLRSPPPRSRPRSRRTRGARTRWAPDAAREPPGVPPPSRGAGWRRAGRSP